MVERGAKAPDFRLPGNEGKIVGLEDFPGKWRVLFFYPKDGTKG